MMLTTHIVEYLTVLFFKGTKMHQEQIIGITFFATALFLAGVAIGAHFENKRLLKKQSGVKISGPEKELLIRDIANGDLKWTQGCTFPGTSDNYREVRELLDMAHTRKEGKVWRQNLLNEKLNKLQ
jgi:hypothetical protein